MISSDPEKFRCLVRARKPYLEYLTFLKYLVYTSLISKTPKKLTQKTLKYMLKLLYHVGNHSNVVKMFFCKTKKKQKKKIKPNFFKIFYFYIFGSSLFLCLFEKIYCGGILKSITSSNTNFEN